jgi:hypothetical protein
MLGGLIEILVLRPVLRSSIIALGAADAELDPAPGSWLFIISYWRVPDTDTM